MFRRDHDGSVKRFYRSGDSGSDEIRDIQMNEKYIWLATTNGVIILDRKQGSEIKRFGTSESLPHNFINKLFPDNGEVYIATETDRFYKIERDLNLSIEGCPMTGSVKNSVESFSKDKTGTIWAATNGNGVFACNKDSIWSTGRSNGLFSNFCYSILADSKNRIWVGHEKGFSLIDYKTDLVKSFGSDYIQNGMCRAGGIYRIR